eukprot:GEMP01053645.1.p1 GENE.GEMP01053645.1~~GEMP01053645.1.p1  ORF type:complete len:221 (+),score=38.09 GEMP01053645.1:220-882(+)
MLSGVHPPSLEGTTVILDAEKIIEKVRDLPTDHAALKIRLKLVGVHEKGSGAVCSFDVELVDDSNLLYYKMVSTFFMVGARNFVGAGETRGLLIKPPARAPDLVCETEVGPHQNLLYRLSGYYNPLHIDAEFAAARGFPKPILHGQCTMSITCRQVLEAFPTAKFKSLQCRFATPVLPGDTLITEMWKEGPHRIIYQSKVKRSGKVCISNAFVDFCSSSL